MADLPQYFFIKVRPGDINGYLQAQGGKILAILGNYTEVFVTPPKLTDDAMQVFAVEVPHEDLKLVLDNEVQKIYLWRGDKASRIKPQDKITCPIFTVTEAAFTPPTAVDPTDAARIALGEYPANIQLALVLAGQTDEVLTTLPDISPARAQAMRNWAQVTVNAFTAAQQAAVGKIDAGDLAAAQGAG